MPDPKGRKAAIASVEHACPRCGASREPRQEYCVECGLRLPQTTGALAALRRRWIRRFGWYPGDWIWTSLLGLVVAVAGAAVAIVLTSHGPKGGTTIAVSTTPQTTAPTTAATTTTPGETTTAAHTTTAAAAPPNGQLTWPVGTTGWTVILGSYPISGGRAAAVAAAKRAVRGHLPKVGVLDSNDWSSLHPGYYVVFSGMYGSENAALAAVTRAMVRGFALPYPRQIAR